MGKRCDSFHMFCSSDEAWVGGTAGRAIFTVEHHHNDGFVWALFDNSLVVAVGDGLNRRMNKHASAEAYEEKHSGLLQPSKN